MEQLEVFPEEGNAGARLAESLAALLGQPESFGEDLARRKTPVERDGVL
jgi:hypothetical protein